MLKDTTRCHQWARTQDLSMNVLQRSPMLYHYVTGVQINQLIYLHVLRICCTSHFCIWLMLAKMATLLGKSWSLALHACYNILCNVLSCSFFFLNGVYTGFIFAWRDSVKQLKRNEDFSSICGAFPSICGVSL